MSINTILLHAAAEVCEPNCGPSAYALGLAKEFRAHLTAQVFELNVAMPRSAYGRQIVAETRAAVAERNVDALERAQRLRKAAAEWQIDAQVLTDRNYAYGIPEAVAHRARLYDLAVTGVDDRGLLSEHSVAEYVLFQSGRPLIVVPDGYDAAFSCARAVVAWDYGRTAARALGDALPLLQRAKEVTVVAFGDDKSMDSSLTREDLLASLRQRGVEARYVQAERASRSIADAINAFAKDCNADLLVMGGYGHSRFRDFILGGATKGILERPVVPTLLAH